jgi:hypothetical protein
VLYRKERRKARRIPPPKQEPSDLPGYTLTEADIKLDEVHGDHIHLNDGTHLTGGITDDSTWKNNTGDGSKTGKRFLMMLTEELSSGIQERKWN